MTVSVASVAVLGPGLPGWESSRIILAGAAGWRDGPVVLPPPAILPPIDRRRASPVVRLALAIAAEAAAASAIPPATLRSVFGSGNGDSLTVCSILEGLSGAEGLISPTQFHNSVHNAAAGYWSIAVGSARPATCLGCYDWTFGAALMKAVAECEVEREPVLLCVYDMPMPEPLAATRPTASVFGAALVLVPEGRDPRLRLRWDAAPAEHHQPLDPALRPLASGNPAARALRLLEILARGESHRLDVALLDGRLVVEITA